MKLVMLLFCPILSVALMCASSMGQAGNHLQLFWNLYSAVVHGSRILHDITEGVGAVSKAIRAIDSFLDLSPDEAEIPEKPLETDLDIDVSLEAANQNSINVKSSFGNEAPVFNGCGALGFHILDDNLPVRMMTDCCRSHDTCYEASCKVNKKDCDSKLRSCLFSICDYKNIEKNLQKNCISAAKLLFSGTMALSFQQFNNAQIFQGCKTQDGKWKNKH